MTIKKGDTTIVNGESFNDFTHRDNCPTKADPKFTICYSTNRWSNATIDPEDDTNLLGESSGEYEDDFDFRLICEGCNVTMFFHQDDPNVEWV